MKYLQSAKVTVATVEGAASDILHFHNIGFVRARTNAVDKQETS